MLVFVVGVSVILMGSRSKLLVVVFNGLLVVMVVIGSVFVVVVDV